MPQEAARKVMELLPREWLHREFHSGPKPMRLQEHSVFVLDPKKMKPADVKGLEERIRKAAAPRKLDFVVRHTPNDKVMVIMFKLSKLRQAAAKGA